MVKEEEEGVRGGRRDTLTTTICIAWAQTASMAYIRVAFDASCLDDGQ